MTPEQNKNFILNNLDKFIIDSRGDFVNLEKDFKDNDYVIWRRSVEDYEEVREEFIKEIIRNKSRWSSIKNKEIIEDLMGAILLEKENWKIIGGREPQFYKYLPTGEKVSASFIDIFNWDQTYILNGELGWREEVWKDYGKWGKYRLENWWSKKKRKQRKNKTNPASQQSKPHQTQNPEKSQSEEERLRAEENKKYEEAKSKPKQIKNQNLLHQKIIFLQPQT